MEQLNLWQLNTFFSLFVWFSCAHTTNRTKSEERSVQLAEVHLYRNINGLCWEKFIVKCKFFKYNKYKKIMKYALCVKLCQHDFIIVIVHKLLVHGHCSESGLHSLLSRSSRCPGLRPLKMWSQFTFWKMYKQIWILTFLTCVAWFSTKKEKSLIRSNLS